MAEKFLTGGGYGEYTDSSPNKEVREIDRNVALDFVIARHYAGRKPQVTIAYGWFFDNKLVAVAIFGKPSNPYLCDGICGKEYSHCVYELNRLVRIESLEAQLSQFVSECLRKLRERDWIIISYADSGMSHHGYIYQACNFLYTGCTKQRTDRYIEGKHPRHSPDNPTGIRQVRTAKYRYVYFCTFNKKLKKEWRNALRYEVLPYPKGDNECYELGTIYYPVLVDKNRNIIHRDNLHEMKIQQ